MFKKLKQKSDRAFFLDKIVEKCISFVGICIILIVLGIFVFIFYQVLPLFIGADTDLKNKFILDKKHLESEYIYSDEWGENIVFLSKNDSFVLNLESSLVKQVVFPIKKPKHLVFRDSKVLLVDEQNKLFLLDFSFYKEFKNSNYTINNSVSTLLEHQLSKNLKINNLAFEYIDNQLSIVIHSTDNQLSLLQFNKENTLFSADAGDLNYTGKEIIAEKIDVKNLFLNAQTHLLVLNNKGEIKYFYRDEGEFSQRKELIVPFEKTKLISMGFVLGGNTFIVSDDEGNLKGYSLCKTPKKNYQFYYLTRENLKKFPLKSNELSFSHSLRNKNFIVASGEKLRVYYATTEALNLEETLDKDIHYAFFNKNDNNLFILFKDASFYQYDYKHLHPEGSLKGYFGKIWYEGQAGPEYKWESVGSSDAFEPKLSMIPLIFGTLKATFYSMLFAIPLALLAALYTSEFLNYKIKAFIKPLIELMASLPSVVIGFLGALWLAPKIYDKVPFIILLFFVVPIVCILVLLVVLYFVKSMKVKNFIKSNSFLIFIPILLLTARICWEITPFFEELLFTYKDSNGFITSDFISWWEKSVGSSYRNLNSLVVGISMGFAVIPIIYTIAEDSISNVPSHIKAASNALGATKWQTIFKVILPISSVGIVSAIMIGLGRAIGETMIVLFCAGGTALLDVNIFNGMRTLSVNLATELPEAPFGGTLFRTLYLGALILFIMTFAINFTAEYFRQHIRKKYKNL